MPHLFCAIREDSRPYHLPFIVHTVLTSHVLFAFLFTLEAFATYVGVLPFVDPLLITVFLEFQVLHQLV